MFFSHFRADVNIRFVCFAFRIQMSRSETAARPRFRKNYNMAAILDLRMR